ncbi:MAG: DUF262 domain-containing protein [Hymenobacter sp.]|nr:MAG: DUF262 domain-containing protein [Hymenobacter sp.]
MSTDNHTYTLHELLIERDTRLRVPSYQRAYSWDRSEWQVFVDDLQEQTDSAYAHEHHYYLGHFLFEPPREGYTGLIDGQQRLTTAMLFTAAVLPHLPAESTALLEQARALLMRTGVARLQVVAYDQRIFERLLERAIQHKRQLVSGSTTAAQSKMTRAVDFFTEWLKHRCFEDIFKSAPRIAGLSEDDVLRFYFYAQHGGYQNDSVLQVLKARVKAGLVSAHDIRDFSEQLSQAFAFIEQYQRPVHGAIVANLLRLDAYPNVVYPFLLKGYFQMHEGSHTFSEVWPTIIKLSDVLEKLVFRFALVNSRARETDRLNEVLLAMPLDARALELKLSELLNSSGYWWYWRDEAFTQSLQTLSYPNRRAIYLLWQYEQSLQRRGYEVAASEVNLNELEHIAPQTENHNPKPGYSNYHDVRFNQEHRNSLGNLLLITRSHNGSIGNIAFSKKLESYQQTPLAHQREVVNFFEKDEAQRWGPKQIQRRHNHLVDWALERWNFSQA